MLINLWYRLNSRFKTGTIMEWLSFWQGAYISLWHFTVYYSVTYTVYFIVINYLFCLKVYLEWYWFFLESQSQVNTLGVVCVSNYCHYNYNEFRQKATRLQSRRKALGSGFLWSATDDHFLSKQSVSRGTGKSLDWATGLFAVCGPLIRTASWIRNSNV